MEQTQNRPKRAYQPPKLVQYGDLQKLTRNGANGSGDGNNSGHLNQSKSCWIAEVLYGVNDSRTHLLRAWLNQVYIHTACGKFVMFSYRTAGHQVAALARRSAAIRALLLPLFDRGLRRAQAHYMSASA